MYIIKQIPEDFVVEEIFLFAPEASGDYSYWRLRKVNLTTLDAAFRIAEQLRIPVKWVKYAGNKDKHAATTQTLSLYRVPRERAEKLDIAHLCLEFLGYSKEPVHLGQHQGNRFQITVRNIDSKPEQRGRIPNYFGAQRFSKNNVDIGRSLVKNDFFLAAELMQDSNVTGVAEHLARYPSDPLGAIRTLPKALLKLYLHSYQSHLWNKTVERCITQFEPKEDQMIPILGFGSLFGQDPVSRIAAKILEEERLNLRDFIIRPLPELSSEGSERELFMKVDEFEMGDLEPDEIFLDKKKITLRFVLGKGSYATVFVDSLFHTA